MLTIKAILTTILTTILTPKEMGTYEVLKQAITNAIKQNGNAEITGDLLQQVLLTIVSNIGKGSIFAGIATPSTNPGTPDENTFYIATEEGVYVNFGGYSVTDKVVVFSNASGEWNGTELNIPNAGNINSVITDIINAIAIYSEVEGITETGIVRSATSSGTTIGSDYISAVLNVEVGEKYKVTCSSLNTSYPAAFVRYYAADGSYRTSTILYTAEKHIFNDEAVTIPPYSRTFEYVNIKLIVNGNVRHLGSLQLNIKQPLMIEGIVDTIKKRIDELVDVATVSYVNTSISEVIKKVCGKNMYSGLNEIAGYLRSDGKSTTITGDWKTTDYIDVSEVERLICSIKNVQTESRSVYNFYHLCEYDENKNTIRTIAASYTYIKAEGTKYIRFSYESTKVAEIQVEEGELRTDYEPYKEYNAIINPKPKEAIEDITKYSDVICCDGDSLTWGHLGKNAEGIDMMQSVNPYPAVLQERLGEDFKVINHGIPGAFSTTIEGNATAFELTQDVTIPAGASSFYIHCKFLREIAGNRVTQFGPVVSTYGRADGGVNPITINGVKLQVRSSVKQTGERYYTPYVQRIKSGAAVLAKSGDIIYTNAGEKYKGAAHIIFMGANGGWHIDGTSSIHTDTNIRELMAQIDDIIRVSNERYIVLSYWAWRGTSVQAWEGEALFAERYGYHYLNTREYFSTQAIADAIAAGYIESATAADTAAMAQGKMPPSFLNANTEDIHMNDIGYRVLGDIVWKKYMEVKKKNILGYE